MAKKITEVFNAMFKNEEWNKITDEEKSEYFFIFNRYYSKMFPERSQLLNDKEVDKVFGMNLIRETLKSGTYPGWFWSKKEKEKEKSEYSDKDIDLLLSKFNLKFEELSMLIKFYPDTVKEELKYIKDGQK